MIFPDANLLLYAINTDSPDHQRAFEWWKATLESGTPVRVASVVAFAFLRLSTNRRVFARPLSVPEAFAYLENWLSFPNADLAESSDQDLPVVKGLLVNAGTGANLVSDAQIAAIALRMGGEVYSADDDFQRFSGIKWHNPLED